MESKPQCYQLSPTKLSNQDTFLPALFTVQTKGICTFHANIISPALIFIAGDVKKFEHPKAFFPVSNSICNVGCKADKKLIFSSLWQIEVPLDFWHFLSPGSEKNWGLIQIFCVEVFISVRAPSLG